MLEHFHYLDVRDRAYELRDWHRIYLCLQPSPNFFSFSN
jgi:hypothetical protein